MCNFTKSVVQSTTMSNIIGMCWQCGECFFTQSKLQEHGRIKHSLFVCKTCGKMFSKSSMLLQHMIAHSKRMHSCSICGEICRQEIDMYIHVIRFHEGKSKTGCDICLKKSRYSYLLRKHLKEKHEVQFSSLIVDGEFYCTIHSSRKLYKGGLLDDPLRVYQKSFKTVNCEAPGSENSNHIEGFLHHPEATEIKSLGNETDMNVRHGGSSSKPNQMEVNIAVMAIQQQTMASEKKDSAEMVNSDQFPCSYCAKCFTSQKSLYQHSRFEHPKETVACPYCKKYFLNKSSLDGHVTGHIRNAHSCSICGKMCKGLLDFHIHLTTFHKERDKSVCTQCGNTLGNKRNLKNHLLSKHENEFLLIASRAELYCSIHSSESFPEDVIFYDSEALHIFKECLDTKEEMSGVQNGKHAEAEDESIHRPNFYLSESNRTETSSVVIQVQKTVQKNFGSFHWDKSETAPPEMTHFEIEPQFCARKLDKCDPEQSPFSKTSGNSRNEIPYNKDTFDIFLQNVDTVEDEISGENYRHTEVTQAAAQEQETSDMDCSSFQWDSSHDMKVFNIFREHLDTLEFSLGENFKPAKLVDENIHELSSHSKPYLSDTNGTEVTTSAVQRQETAGPNCTSSGRGKCEKKLDGSEAFSIFKERSEALDQLTSKNDNPFEITGESTHEHSSMDLKAYRSDSNRAEETKRQETPDRNCISFRWGNSYEMLLESEAFSNFRDHSETLEVSVRENCKYADVDDHGCQLYRSELERAEVAQTEPLAVQSKRTADSNCSSLQGDKNVLMFYDSEVFNIFQEYSAALEVSVSENHKPAELVEHSS